MPKRPSLVTRVLGKALAHALDVRQSESKTVQFVGSWDNLHWLDGDPDIDAEKLTTATAFAISAYCYSAMIWRASRVAEPPLQVSQESDDGEEWVPTHPLAMRLAEPRPDISMGEMLTRVVMYRDLYGHAAIVRDVALDGSTVLLTPYSGDEMKISPAPPLIYGRYEFRDPRGGFREIEVDRVIHFRDVSPMSWYQPTSKVQAALSLLDQGHHVNRIVRRMLQNAMFPGGIISADKDWDPSDAEWEAWVKRMEGWYTGPSKTGKPLFTNGGTTVQTVSSSLKDLLPEAVLDRVEASVGSVFGVPPVVLGWLVGLKNSPWSQFEEARRQAYDDTIAPMWRDVEARLTRGLLTREERDRGLVIRFDTRGVKALAEDEERKARISALNSDTWTVNERRMFTGQEPLDEADERGDRIAGLSTGSPVPDSIGAGDEDEEEEEEPEQDDEEDLDDDDDDEEDEDEEEEDGKIRRNFSGVKADTKDLLWLVFDLDCKSFESDWTRTIHGNLRELRDQITKAAQRTLRLEKSRISDASRDAFQLLLDGILDGNRPRLITKTFPLIVGQGTKAIRRLTTRLGVSFSVAEPGLLDYAKTEAAFLARVMGEATGAAVAKKVQESLVEGGTIADLVKDLRDLPEFTVKRAKLVARTETTRAWNGAQRRAMVDIEKETGKKATKSWLSSRDDRVRDEHVALDDGSAIPIDQPFGNGLQAPGEPNCRCTLLYALSD